ncbi:MAG: hypothetical protein GY806_16910 [Gammaproteobacteria bacterium]|nr:hypothetical protein [Gammaproteobacteria bacterium]
MAWKNNVQWYLLLAVLASSLGTVYYHFKDYFEPRAAQTLDWDSECDLHLGSCELQIPGGGSVQFEITPKSIPLLQSMALDVRVSGIDVDSVEVDFVGVNMNMGFNRSKLKAVDEGSFSGQIILPVCVRNRMHWEAGVMLETETGIILAPFRFETVKVR